MCDLYIGLMSGTSMDGIDVALVDFTDSATLIASHCEPLPSELVKCLRQLNAGCDNELDKLAQADVQLGKLFAQAVNNLLAKTPYQAKDIQAIGSHGQTIRHKPDNNFSYTIQIADPNIIALETGITTVADFRRKDIALGGHGAPLAPAFHQAFMAGDMPRVILNIGGIANVTLLNGDDVIGFDTGPGNCLLDAWYRQHNTDSYDTNGNWAATGRVIPELLNTLLASDYFLQVAPKSTGTEYFNLTWLQNFLNAKFKPEDLQATLVELTAATITDAISKMGLADADIFVCGGGVHNDFLMQRLAALHQAQVASTTELGIDPDWVEAMAFAWFAKNTLEQKPSNLPQVTGTSRAAILGGVYYS